jgi:hypothetical protein
MTRLLHRFKHLPITQRARNACRRIAFVIGAVREGMPVSVAVSRSKSLFFPTVD